jgi:hypothetical protein
MTKALSPKLEDYNHNGHGMQQAWGINKWLQNVGLKITRTDHFRAM